MSYCGAEHSDILQGFIEETQSQVFSSECCKFFKNTYFEEHLPTAAFLPSFSISPIRIIEKLTSCYIWFHVVQMHYSARDHSFSTYAEFSERVTFLIPWYAQQQRVRNVENFAYVLNQSSFLRAENRGKELALPIFLLLLLFCIFLFNLMIVTCLFNLMIVACIGQVSRKNSNFSVWSQDFLRRNVMKSFDLLQICVVNCCP